MKEEELPQDKSALENFTREICYVQGEDGKYITGLSTGWETKTIALDKQWEEINRRVKEAKQDCLAEKTSPIRYYLELRLMDISVLAGYTGFFQWQIKRHISPSVFKRLSKRRLQK
ncbi:MAG: hypothetical protein O3A39_11850, partial [Proteobacteria bacterium]|nr:hypothetical protein [Pseudomonadota bacterium]